MIPYNKPYLTGAETEYIRRAVESGKISGGGLFTQKCCAFFETRYGFHKTLLTTSCTDALEMSALLLDVQPGDEIILPAFTFVSTANAFVLRGARLVFTDSETTTPNLDAAALESLVTPKTKAIVAVHYAGIACDMDAVLAVAKKYNLFVVEDAAQAIDSYYKGKPLGALGHLAAFSFHETKNIISGEGGMLAVNWPDFVNRAEILWEKGTNRAAFFRGETDKYNWVDVGSSFLPSEIVSAFLYAQIEHLDDIQRRRKQIWDNYFTALKPLADSGRFSLPFVPDYAGQNGHIFYLVLPSLEERTQFISTLKEAEILTVFHYISLHKSPFYAAKHDGRDLPNSDKYTDCLVRLPLYYGLTDAEQNYIIDKIIEFYN